MPLNNYLKSLAEQKRICPRCHENELEILPIGQGVRDWGVEVCYKCGYSHYVYAPKNACIGNDPAYDPFAVDEEAETLSRILRVLLPKSLNYNANMEAEGQLKQEQESKARQRQSRDIFDDLADGKGEENHELIIIKPDFGNFEKKDSQIDF